MPVDIQLIQLVTEIDYYSFISIGVKWGLIITISVGFIGVGANYALKLFKLI